MPTPHPDEARAPAVVTRGVLTRADEETALRDLYVMLIRARWYEPRDARLSPYRAALLLSQGYADFQRDFAGDMEACARIDPAVAGRVDVRLFCRQAWGELHNLLREWCIGRTGKARSLKWVIDFFERNFKHRPRPVDPAKAVWEVETVGAPGTGAGVVADEFFGSAMKRKGTSHELIEDIADPALREAEHRKAEIYHSQIRRAQSEKDGS